MLDSKLLRSDPDAVAANLARRGFKLDVAQLNTLEEVRKKWQVRADELDFFSLVEIRPNEGTIKLCGRRAILLHTDAMGALRKELVEALGADAAKVVLTRYGFSCGHEDAGLLAS